MPHHESAREGTPAQIVEDAITSRRSVRAFLPKPVPQGVVEHLLDVAARAPSGTNMQPWLCIALAGDAKERLSTALLAAHAEGPGNSEYAYYPDPFFEPYLARRRKVGLDMYGLLGIGKGEHARMHAQHGLNLTFFGAPVGLIFTIDRRLKIGSWLDYGMFLQNIMIAARAHGLDTCPQAAFAPYHDTIRTVLGIPEGQMVIGGMALGYADPESAINQLTTTREPAAAFTQFIGF